MYPSKVTSMADGSLRPIEDVRVGDLVLAADPVTGETAAEEVTDLITGDGVKDLVRVGADTDSDGVPEWVTATAGHPFYVTGEGWVDAGDLEPGDLLVGDDGIAIEVIGLDASTRVAVVHNLTVDRIHTYYVAIGAETALAHNCSILQKNHILRIGPTYQGGPFRVSLGAQRRHWQQLPVWRQRLQPFHVHMERARAGVTYNPSGRSMRLWGNWR